MHYRAFFFGLRPPFSGQNSRSHLSPPLNLSGEALTVSRTTDCLGGSGERSPHPVNLNSLHQRHYKRMFLTMILNSNVILGYMVSIILMIGPPGMSCKNNAEKMPVNIW
jgi:hypothetical protein